MRHSYEPRRRHLAVTENKADRHRLLLAVGQNLERDRLALGDGRSAGQGQHDIARTIQAHRVVRKAQGDIARIGIRPTVK